MRSAIAVSMLLFLSSEIVYACSATSVTIISPSAGSKCTFNNASTGVKEISCSASAIPSGRTGYITWSCENITDTVETWPYGSNGGGPLTLTLSGLPSSNSSFGDTWIKASVDSVSDTKHILLFYSEEATNNPGGSLPNWYYYWSQTSAHYGTHNYDSSTTRSYTNFISGAWRSYIGSDTNEYAGAGTWDNAEGIDFFANVCRHEERHRLDMSTLWGSSNNRTQVGDPDEDYLPTDNGTVTENSLGTAYHSSGYDPTIAASVPDDLDYGEGFRDCEDYALHRQASWTNGSANSSDWANPGKQY